MVNGRDAKRVLELVDEKRDDIVDLERALLRFDSVNQPPWGNEGPCQRFVAERMKDLGLTVDCFTPDQVSGIEQAPAYLHGRDYTDRPNVVGTLAGAGGGPSLHLAAHADVVPIGKAEDWSVEPFGGDVIEGCIYGRGAVDDRDGLTAMLSALQVIQLAGYRLRGDLIMTSYVDEEFAGGNGLLSVVRKGYRGDAAINCDGVGFFPFVANTGGGPFRVIVQSKIDAPNPTPSMRRAQTAYKRALADLSRRWLVHWSHPLYPPGTPWIVKREPIEVKDWEEGLSGWDWLTHGPACGVSAYATTLPGQAREQAKAEIVETLEQAYAACDCADLYPPRVEWVYRFMDACEVPPTEAVVLTVGRAHERVTGRVVEPVGGPRGDTYVLALHGGVPTVTFGPGGWLAGPGTAHQPDERIDIDEELLPFVKILVLAVMDFCGYV